MPALEASPQVLGGRAAVPITLRLPPGAVPPRGVRIGVFQAGSSAKLADVSRPFAIAAGAYQATLSLDAEPGRYDIRLLRPDKTRAALTRSARVTVAGIDREPGWWLFNGSPLLAASASPVAGAPFFWPGLKRSAARSDKARSANTRTGAPVTWRTLPFPPLSEWLRDPAAAREAALASAREAQSAGGGFVGCVMFAAQPEGAEADDEATRRLSRATPEAVLAAAQAARAACEAISREAPLILSIESLAPALAARVVDLAAPECDAVHLVGFDASDAAALWPLKAARRVAEEQPQFDLPLFVSPRDAASAAEAWMSGATGFVLPAEGEAAEPGVAELSHAVEASLNLFVGSVTLEDTGLLRAGDALTLFRRAREAGRIPLLARTFEAAGRRDRSGREGRRVGEPFALRWVGGPLPPDLLSAVRDATRDGSRVYIEGNPLGASDSSGSGDWRDLLQSAVRAVGDAPSTSSTSSDDYAPDAADASPAGGRPSVLTMEDVWTFGVARGQSVPVEQRVVATPVRTPSPVELGDAAPPRGQSPRERDSQRPAPRVVARLSDGSAATMIAPAASTASTSIRRDAAGLPQPRGEVVWTPHLIRSGGPSSALGVATYDSAIGALLQPALVRLFDREAGGEAALGLRVSVRASAKGTLLLAVSNPSGRARAVRVQAQAPGGYVFDLVSSRAVPARSRSLRVEVDLDVPARGYRLLAMAEDARKFEQELSQERLKARVR